MLDGEWVWGAKPFAGVASLSGDVITGCGTGVSCTGGDLYINISTFEGAPVCDWALNASSLDTLEFNGNFVDDWTNGLSIASCMHSEVRLNEIAGRQEGRGIMCSACSTRILDNYVDRFLTAIRCESDAAPVITNNSLSCAADWGANNVSSGPVVDARGNWWGDVTGPYHPTSNPSGLGSPVSDNVDFSSWLLDYPNRPPFEFSLLWPPKGAVLDTCPVLDWEDSRDLDCHDILTYTVLISDDSLFKVPIAFEGLIESSFDFPDSLLVVGKRYFWRAYASDGDTLTWCTQLDWDFTIDPFASLTAHDPAIPGRWMLAGSVPNPLRISTQIRLGVPAPGRATIDLFDINGRLVRRLLDSEMLPGYHAVMWDGKDSQRRPVASGVYFCRLTGGGVISTKKVIVTR
jgi:hypothetical protein